MNLLEQSIGRVQVRSRVEFENRSSWAFIFCAAETNVQFFLVEIL